MKIIYNINYIIINPLQKKAAISCQTISRQEIQHKSISFNSNKYIKYQGINVIKLYLVKWQHIVFPKLTYRFNEA